MKDTTVAVALVVLLIAAFLGYQYLTVRPVKTTAPTTPKVTSGTSDTPPVAAKGETPAPPAEDEGEDDKTATLKLNKDQAEQLSTKLVNVPVRVVKIIDGDTIDIELPAGLSVSGIVRIRLGGIDAPERGAAYSKKAREKVAELTAGGTVTLEFDKFLHDGKYGRLIAYVFPLIEGGVRSERRMLNAELVRAGLAQVSIYEENEKYARELVAAQREARAAKVGIWQQEKKGDENSYLADKMRWRFHRPSCEWAKKIPADKLVKYESKGAAFDDGRIPCSKCKP